MVANSNVWVPIGEDLLAAVRALRRAGATWIGATGWIDRAQLSIEPADGAKRVERVAARAALVSLQAASEGPVMVTLAYATSAGTRVTGGALLEAQSVGVHLVALAGAQHEPAWVSRGDAGALSPAEPRAVRVGDPGRSSRAEPPLVSASVSANAAAPPDEDADDSGAEQQECDERPGFGDRVLHARFGLCDVMVVRGERLKIRDVHGEKRLREVSLSVLKVLRPRVQDGKRVFPLARR